MVLLLRLACDPVRSVSRYETSSMRLGDHGAGGSCGDGLRNPLTHSVHSMSGVPGSQVPQPLAFVELALGKHGFEFRRTQQATTRNVDDPSGLTDRPRPAQCIVQIDEVTLPFPVERNAVGACVAEHRPL